MMQISLYDEPIVTQTRALIPKGLRQTLAVDEFTYTAKAKWLHSIRMEYRGMDNIYPIQSNLEEMEKTMHENFAYHVWAEFGTQIIRKESLSRYTSEFMSEMIQNACTDGVFLTADAIAEAFLKFCGRERSFETLLDFREHLVKRSLKSDRLAFQKGRFDLVEGAVNTRGDTLELTEAGEALVELCYLHYGNESYLPGEFPRLKETERFQVPETTTPIELRYLPNGRLVFGFQTEEEAAEWIGYLRKEGIVNAD